MIGDVLLIEQKHERVARELAARIRPNRERLVVAIGGESGSGKSEIAETLRKVLRAEEIRVKILHLDNYYIVAPSERTEHRRQHGMDAVGVHEIDWELLEENIESFRQARPTTIPFLDLYTDQEDKLVTDFKKIDLLIVEGLYACQAPADIRVLIDLTYHDTKKAQHKRKKEKVDKFRYQVLEKEHQAVQAIRHKADYLVTPGFTLVDHTGRKESPQTEEAQRIVFCSAQLPFSVQKRRGRYALAEKVGGVASAVGSVYQAYDSAWFGSLDLPARTQARSITTIQKAAQTHNCQPLFLKNADLLRDAETFCEQTIWPLFHYRPESASFDEDSWKAYEAFNKAYFEAIRKKIKPNDIVWIHDYQLMLLPAMIRREFPDILIGFFLHTPFPSFEVFRLLPWRRQILSGILGADLIGFHIYEYTRHFQSCLFRILGLEAKLGSVIHGDRLVHTDAFSLGVDFNAFAQIRKTNAYDRALDRLQEINPGGQIVLSVDRLDPTRGILEKISTIEALLEQYKNLRVKTTFLLRTFGTPSTTILRNYAKQVDTAVAACNKRFSQKNWTPILHQHADSSRAEMAALYNVADVLLVGSLRDGMNLIGKEYVAARQSDRGVIVLSEFAGGSRELSEAILINPHDRNGCIGALAAALTMPVRKQATTFARMKQRQQRNTALNWSVTFLESLRNVKLRQVAIRSHSFSARAANKVTSAYQASKQRLLLFDYNGTLVPVPKDGRSKPPAPALIELLMRLAGNRHNRIAIITDNSRPLVEHWFHKHPVDLIACSDASFRRNSKWTESPELATAWQNDARPILEKYVIRTPGSYIDEKRYALIWHFENAEKELGEVRARELMDDLRSFAGMENLQVNEVGRLIEIRNAETHKASMLRNYLDEHNYDFIFAAGDDQSNEAMFAILPNEAITVRIGSTLTSAQYNLPDHARLLAFLNTLK
ncbi:MAG: bifunctional alpha,alpha-trehalose-phosphate synthase (UDP-forming)/trehalose-phosphatase [Kiritimatiellia bacterium]